VDKFSIDKFKNEIYIGTHYWRYPTPEAERWEVDMPILEKVGIDIVQLRVQWAWHERVEGKPIWEDLDRLFAITKKAGIRVMLKFMLETAPEWIYDKYDAYRINPNGTKIIPKSHGAFYVGGWLPCFDNPNLQKAAKKYVAKVVTRYKDQEHLILWQAWNEVRSRPYGECCCKYSKKLHATYLKSKFKNINVLNKFAGTCYVGFDSVKIPVDPNDSYLEALWFRQFRAKAVADNLQWVYDTIRLYDKSRPTMAHVGMSSPVQNVLQDCSDDIDCASRVDFYGTSMVSWSGAMKTNFKAEREALMRNKNAAQEMFLYSMVNRRLKNVSPYYWVYELYCRSWYYLRENLRPQDIEFQTMTSIAEGAKGIVYWQLHNEKMSCESGCSGLLSSNFEIQETGEYTKKFYDLIKKNEKLFVDYEPSKAKVAILYDFDSDVVSACEDLGCHQIADENYRYKESLRGFISLLFQNGVCYEIIDTKNLPDLSRFELVIAPCLISFYQEKADWLYQYVANGGRLWTENDFALREENTFIAPLCPNFGLSEKLGYRQIENHHLEKEYSLIGKFKGVKAVDYKATVIGAKATYFEKKIKKGVFCNFTFMPGYTYRKKAQANLVAVFGQILNSLDLVTKVHKKNIYLREGLSDKKKVLFIANYSFKNQKFKMPKGYKKIIHGKKIATNLILKPWGWAVITE
jgi:beta-galactosidase GanA